jgi:ArsR family transcriptional regulator
MNLAQHVDTLNLLGDEKPDPAVRPAETARALRQRSGEGHRRGAVAVSTHLGRLREAGFVAIAARGRSRSTPGHRQPAQPGAADPGRGGQLDDPTLDGDQQRLIELDAERRGGLPDSAVDEIERDYSPGRTWHSLAVGVTALLKLGDVLDAGSGDGAAARSLAPYCRSLTCIDTNPRMIEAARERWRGSRTSRAQVAIFTSCRSTTRRSTRS